MMLRLLTLLLIALSGVICASATTDTVPKERPLTSVYYASAGYEKALSTYLSPIMHSGAEAGIGGEWSRDLKCRKFPLRQRYRAEFKLGFLSDHSGSSGMNDLQLTLGWQLMRRISPLPALQLGVGTGIMAEAGMLYLPRNSNNPVAARLSADLSICASAAFSTRIGRFPFRIIEQVELPSIGIFFSPHFGQSYYEIYLGERSGLVRCGWWGNHFGIHNLAGVEIPVCGIRLRIGYGLEIRSSYVSHINTRITTHSCVLGICTDWTNVTRKASPRP